MRSNERNITFLAVIFLLVLFTGCAGLLGPDVKPGQVLFEEGKYGESLEHYEALMAAGEANAKVYRLAYESAFKAGKRATAEKYYGEALKAGFDADSLTSLAVDLWYERALYTMGTNNWSEGRKSAARIGELAPGSDEDSFCNWILEGKQKYDRGAHKGLWDALSDYAKAANYDKTSGLPYYLMGQARYKNNRTDYDAALQNYYEALKVEPDGAFVKQANAEIRKIEATKKKMNAFWGK